MLTGPPPCPLRVLPPARRLSAKKHCLSPGYCFGLRKAPLVPNIAISVPAYQNPRQSPQNLGLRVLTPANTSPASSPQRCIPAAASSAGAPLLRLAIPFCDYCVILKHTRKSSSQSAPEKYPLQTMTPSKRADYGEKSAIIGSFEKKIIRNSSKGSLC